MVKQAQSKRKPIRARSKKVTAIALHAIDKEGVNHVVGIGNIRVVISYEDNHYFAQGLEIDYAAQGTTLAEVKRNFENGLTATIEQHLKVYKSIKGVLEAAPKEVWQEALLNKTAIYRLYSQVSGHQIHEALPFEGINYLVPKSAGACA